MVDETPGNDSVKVLLVENDPNDAELCVLALERGGFEVTAQRVDAPEDLLPTLQSGTWDLVLADYRLPGWTGMEAFEAMREAGFDIPFILVTGTLSDDRALGCLAVGVFDYVMKDHIGRLSLTVRRALDERRTRVERQLSRDRIRKLTLAVDQGPASVLITDTNGVIEYVNRTFTEITGYEPHEALGKSTRLLQSGQTPPETYRDLWDTIKAGRTWRGEILNRRRDGALYWDLLTIAPVRDDDGAVTNFLSTQQDITERKRIDEEIREREARFRQMAENIQEVFFLVAADFSETLYVNPAYEQVWGVGRASLYADPRSFLDPVHPDDLSNLMATIGRIQSGLLETPLEFRIVRHDGEVRWILSQAVPVPDEQGRVYRLAGVAMDITDRHRAQAALEESEERFRKLVEASFHGIDITQDGIILDGNPGLGEMFGYPLEEMIGRPAVEFVAEESRAEVQQRMDQGVEGSYELVGLRKDGARIQIEATARSHTIEGAPARITALRDVTRIRTLEEQFRQAQKMEAVGRLAGGVAHDFNNLLTVITSYVEMLLDDVPAGDPRHADLREIRKAAEGASGLTRQLLAFSRQQVIAPRVVVLEEVVSNTEKLLKRVLGEDVSLVTALNERRSNVLIDPGQLEQVLMNLVVNARDAMPTGGRLTLETGQVELVGEEAQDHWPASEGIYGLVAVSDDGHGMDEETKARIFEPFFTVYLQ